MDKSMQAAREIITGYDGAPLRIMEVCGTHTHEIFRLGIRKLLPKQVELISGPGCPVCVTPVGFIDEAILLAEEYGVTVCTFGDLVRVPGTDSSLAGARPREPRCRWSMRPWDAVDYAKNHPEEQVCFLSVGFETTTPASCLAVELAKKQGLTNFSLLTANKTMPMAYQALKGSADVFLYPGHVNAITGHQALRAAGERRSQRCGCRLYSQRTADGIGGGSAKVQGGKALLCERLPQSGHPGGQRQGPGIGGKAHGALRCPVAGTWNDPRFRYAAPGGIRGIRCPEEISDAED